MTAILRYAAQALAITAAAVLIGYLPTLHLGGPAALPGMVAGCVIGLVASLAGAVAVFFLVARSAPAARPAGIVASTMVRLLTAAVLGGLAVASGRFALRPLMVWIALSYLVNLVVEVRYATRSFPRDVER